ncbi:MAG: hypothetical protein ACK56I_08790, partial [bacterium]
LGFTDHAGPLGVARLHPHVIDALSAFAVPLLPEPTHVVRLLQVALVLLDPIVGHVLARDARPEGLGLLSGCTSLLDARLVRRAGGAGTAIATHRPRRISRRGQCVSRCWRPRRRAPVGRCRRAIGQRLAPERFEFVQRLIQLLGRRLAQLLQLLDDQAHFLPSHHRAHHPGIQAVDERAHRLVEAVLDRAADLSPVHLSEEPFDV